MYETKIAEYWAQAQLCSTKADSVKGHASKQLWMQMAQDWVAMADSLGEQNDQQNYYRLSIEPLKVSN